VTQTRAELRVGAAIQADGGQQGGRGEDREIHQQFAVTKHVAEPAGEQTIVENEVGAGQQHEHGHHAVHKRGIKLPDAGILRGKTARGHRGEGVRQRVEQVQAAAHQQNGFDDGEDRVDQPDDLGGLGDARRDLVHGGARGFGLDQLQAAHSQQRQDGHGEHHDAHSSQPMSEGAPEQNRGGMAFDIRENRGAGGGQAGHRLEQGIAERGDRPRQHERDRAEQGGRQPAAGHQEKTAAGGQEIAFFTLQSDDRRQAPADPQSHRHAEGPGAAGIPVEQGHRQRQDHAAGYDENDERDETDDLADVHAEPVKSCSISALFASRLITMTSSPACRLKLPSGRWC